ncbi:hypothetical protein [Yoonia litorea]|uniref:Uncharacterized protein n=1 Tax=Yoonia litorea TaxID=1123755 RepID=A0A1I6M7C7_9RHOB|nr:hypothetical protein [Yoonia litorea]SFS11645.1 hypothetical protein SAMN05444714_1337 [Yoonia litorea]
MSFDIGFWRYHEGAEEDHVAVYAALLDGEDVAAVQQIDTAAMVATLGTVLKGWTREGEIYWTSPQHRMSAQTGDKLLALSMNFGAARSVLLKVSTPMRRYGCGLWNPQMNAWLPGYDIADN